ncbi:MAG: putative glycoside hydrolase [Bacillota bacterium]|nr:putative glycoside hydrolase [Bacillota bacterium]
MRFDPPFRGGRRRSPERGRGPALALLLVLLLSALPALEGCQLFSKPAGEAMAPQRERPAGSRVGGGSGSESAAPAVGEHLPAPPREVRGIYLSGYTAGDPGRVAELLRTMRANGLNAVVIDVKDDSGWLSFPLPGTAAQELGTARNKIGDVAGLLRLLHRNGIYVIGRVVAFADPLAAARRPEWAIRAGDRLWTDDQGRAWLSLWSRGAWDYNIQIGVAAARLGFDEIQYDFVRLPAQAIPELHDAGRAGERVARVVGFLKAAREAIGRAAGVPVSADVVGISPLVRGDSLIGQSYPEVAAAVDVVSPMIYPSLYGRGQLGMADPSARPYDVVWQTLAAAEARTADLPRAAIRPWIQDFTLGPTVYGAREVEGELRALAAAGIRSFLLWNAESRYSPGVDFSVLDKTPEKAPAPVWSPALYGLLPSRIPVELPSAVPPPPAGMATSVRVNATAGGYSVELWATPRPLPADDPRIARGRLLLVVGAAAQSAALAPRPAPGAKPETLRLASGMPAELAPSGGGVVLRWAGPRRIAWVWAPDRATALAAADSLRAVPLLSGR